MKTRVVLALCLAASVICAQTTIDIGVGNPPNEAMFPYWSTQPWLRAKQVTIPERAVIESVTLYHSGGLSYFVCGVYADDNDKPGKLLAITFPDITMRSAGWQGAVLQNPITVGQFSRVWLAWGFELNTVGVAYTGGPGYRRAQNNAVRGFDMPDDFGNASYAAYDYAVYCTITTLPPPPATCDVSAFILKMRGYISTLKQRLESIQTRLLELEGISTEIYQLRNQIQSIEQDLDTCASSQ